MPITSGTAAITIFAVDDADKAKLKEITVERLQNCMLRPLEGADKKAMGFAPIHDQYNYKEWHQSPDVGEFIALAYRMDTKRVSGAVLKKLLSEAAQKELKETGKEFIARARKNELKEHLEFQLLTKTEPVPAIYEAVINHASGTVYLDSSSTSVVEDFRQFFAACFAVELTELQNVFISESIDPEIQTKFLTQIVRQGFTSEDGTSFFATGSITVADDAKKLSGKSRDDEEIQEILSGIDSGMTTVKTGVIITPEGEESETCAFSTDATFRFSGLKLPSMEKTAESDMDKDSIVLERMFLIEKYTGLFIKAFRQFARS